MNGELAQLVALAVHGSAWLASGAVDPPDLIGSTAFQFVRAVGFRLRGGPTLDSTPAWFAALRSRGVGRLVVAREPIRTSMGVAPHYLAAFSNSGGWLLVAPRDRREEAWRATWEVDPAVSSGRRPMPEDRRIWSVRYEGDEHAAVRRPVVSVDAAQARLIAAAEAAETFAAREGWAEWAEWLATSIQLAGSPDPQQPHHHDILPASAALEIRRLLASASQAWVFGGMGWWTDQSPADPARKDAYEAITAELFDAVVGGIVAAANAATGGADQA